MRPIGDTFLDPQARVQNAAGRARVLGKAIATRDLRGGTWDQKQEPPQHQHKDESTGMRHSGTDGDVPFRHAAAPIARRLTAPFTAQLLGQILPDPERRPSAQRFYGQDSMRLSLGLDTSL